MIGSVWFESMPASRVIFTFLQQLAAYCEPIEVLLIGQLPRRNVFESAKSQLAFAFALRVKVWREAPQFSAAGGQPGVGGGEGRHIFEQRFKMPRKQSFKLAGRLVHTQSNA